MWKPLRLVIKDLLSHSNSEYVFDNGKTVMIYGINKDDDGAQSNGAGKSGIIEGITIALTGSPFRKVKNVDLIKNGELTSEITFTLCNTPLDSILTIRRIIHRSKPMKVELWENGVLNEKLKDLHSRETDKRIAELLDISFDDLLNYFLISKNTYTSFFLSGDVAKKEIINRFSRANLVDPVKDFIDSDVTQKDMAIAEIDRQIYGVNSKLEVYKEQLEEELLKEESNEVQEIELKINQHQQSLKDTSDFISYCEEEYFSDLFQNTTWNPTDFSLERESNRLKDVEIKESIKEQRIALKEFNTLLDEIERNLAGVIECPKCEHKFILKDKEFSIVDANKMLPEIKQHIQDLEEAIEKSDVTQASITKDRLDITSKEYQEGQKKANLDSSLKNNERQLSYHINNLSLISNQIKSSQVQIDELKNRTSDIDKITNQIIELNANLALIEEQKNNLISEKALIEIWIANFKRFKSYLANQSIVGIQNLTNSYLQNMKTNLSVIIDGFRALANGKVKEEITTMLTRDGLNAELFEKFSGGEKTKADIACILAMNKLICLNSKSGGIDLLFLDEIIESVDAEGVRSIINSLSKLEQNIFVITHVNPDTNLDCEKLIIQKKDGYSSIIKELIPECEVIQK